MEYVIIDCKRNWMDFKPDSVLIVEKHRPEWQKGRLNLPGGKVEAKESPEMAAVRELREETGITEYNDVKVIGKIVDGDAIIHCVQVELKTLLPKISPAAGETEQPIWTLWSTVRDDPRLIPNLRVIIPLMRAGVWFEITDEYRSKGEGTHTVSLTLSDPGGKDANQSQ